ncbi:Hypothetical protein A7982_11495 [Minicystis rosea]|nr:Hypothetical protein A7982_11495 [Minicystis rosea]
MITREQAHRLVRAHAERKGAIWFDDVVVDRGGYWFFRVGYVGSCGVIVDKADGRLSVMGSALSLDDCFWGHEHGFSPGFLSLCITNVRDHRSTVELLLHLISSGPPRTRNPNPKRAWLSEKIESLPCVFEPQNLWLSIPTFREVLQQGWFEYQVREP